MNADDGAVGREITEHFFELRGRDLASENEASGRSAVGEPRDERARGLGRCGHVGQHAIDRDIDPVHLEKRACHRANATPRARARPAPPSGFRAALQSAARRARAWNDEAAGTHTEQRGKHLLPRWNEPSLVVRVALLGAPPRSSTS